MDNRGCGTSKQVHIFFFWFYYCVYCVLCGSNDWGPCDTSHFKLVAINLMWLFCQSDVLLGFVKSFTDSTFMCSVKWLNVQRMHKFSNSIFFHFSKVVTWDDTLFFTYTQSCTVKIVLFIWPILFCGAVGSHCVTAREQIPIFLNAFGWGHWPDINLVHVFDDLMNSPSFVSTTPLPRVDSWFLN